MAELEEALRDVKGTLHHVIAGEDSTENERRKLGPTLTTTVLLEGTLCL